MKFTGPIDTVTGVLSAALLTAGLLISGMSSIIRRLNASPPPATFFLAYDYSLQER